MSRALPEPARWCAAALILHDGRYLMQQRDDKPGILLPGHWSFFGGALDPGEAPEAAIRRELAEELEFFPRTVERFTEMQIELVATPRRQDRMTFFLAEASADDLARMVQHEGAGRGLFTADALAAEPRVSPWDLAIVLMHARRAGLFPGGSAGRLDGDQAQPEG